MFNLVKDEFDENSDDILESINKMHDLTDEEVVAVIKKQVKMRKDSIAEFEKFGKVEEVQNVINRTQNQNFGIPINIIEE